MFCRVCKSSKHLRNGPKVAMRIAFLAIGDELLRNESREGNAAVLSDNLQQRATRLSQVGILPDDFAAIAQHIGDLLRQPTLVVISGGLGPTDDDFTRQAVAQALDLPVIRREDTLAALKKRYASLGRAMDPSNERQADFPQGAEVLANDFGSAPGFALAARGSLIACFPGVPSEFSGMLSKHLDQLLRQAQIQTVVRREITLRLFGIAESDMQGILTKLPHYSDVAMRSLPKFPDIRLKLAEKDDPIAYDLLLAEVRKAFTWRIYGEGDDDSHAAATLRALQKSKATLALAESCTGGLIAHFLTEVPGASATLRGGVVAYANAFKSAFLDVAPGLIASEGAVSEAVACAMAEGVRRRSGATVAVATTGIAGPTGATAGKPVGTVWIATATASGVEAKCYRFGGLPRSRWKVLVAHTVFAKLRKWADAQDQSA